MRDADLDMRVRLAAFEFLKVQTMRHGEVLPRKLLEEGLDFDGMRVPLISPQGIFKPSILPEMPLTICTVPEKKGKARPYDDEVGPNGYIRYKYRGTDPLHRDNAGLRLAMQRQAPLIYLYGVLPGAYRPAWPAFIVGDDPAGLCFTVAVDEEVRLESGMSRLSDSALDGRRAYITQVTQRRLHQVAFRAKVLRAYDERCAICSLRHRELLDAAHILPDGHPRGEPIVPNGLALCRLHHGAFDGNFLGIRPDFKIEVRADIMDEEDGPMLLHGLQGFNEELISVPRGEHLKPNRDFLEERYAEFRKAG